MSPSTVASQSRGWSQLDRTPTKSLRHSDIKVLMRRPAAQRARFTFQSFNYHLNRLIELHENVLNLFPFGERELSEITPSYPPRTDEAPLTFFIKIKERNHQSQWGADRDRMDERSPKKAAWEMCLSVLTCGADGTSSSEWNVFSQGADRPHSVSLILFITDPPGVCWWKTCKWDGEAAASKRKRSTHNTFYLSHRQRYGILDTKTYNKIMKISFFFGQMWCKIKMQRGEQQKFYFFCHQFLCIPTNKN